MPYYKKCDHCADARRIGNWEYAIQCQICNGTGWLQEDSRPCNKCGNPMPEDEYGLQNATVSGGYSSPCLTDQASYEFNLCESCLVALFDSFVVPPKVRDHDSGDTTYEDDRRRHE